MRSLAIGENILIGNLNLLITSSPNYFFLFRTSNFVLRISAFSTGLELTVLHPKFKIQHSTFTSLYTPPQLPSLLMDKKIMARSLPIE